MFSIFQFFEAAASKRTISIVDTRDQKTSLNLFRTSLRLEFEPV